MLLALDISLTTGAAWGGPSSHSPRSAVCKLPEGRDNFDRALVGLRDYVMMMCKFEKVEIVAIEAAMRRVDREHSEYAAFLLTSLSAVAREAASRHGARIVPAECHTWRRHFIGSGNLSGEDSKRAAMKMCDRLGWTYQDHNAAEACGVWHWGMARHFPKWNPPKMRVAEKPLA